MPDGHRLHCGPWWHRARIRTGYLLCYHACSSSCWNSLTKHTFSDRIIKNFKMATAEHLTERGVLLNAGPCVAQEVGPVKGSTVCSSACLYIISAHLQRWFFLVTKGSAQP